MTDRKQSGKALRQLWRVEDMRVRIESLRLWKSTNNDESQDEGLVSCGKLRLMQRINMYNFTKLDRKTAAGSTERRADDCDGRD